MKKAECIVHFSNYLMEQEDTARTNTLSSDTLPAGFQLIGLLTGRQSLPKLPTPPAAHHQTPQVLMQRHTARTLSYVPKESSLACCDA